MKARKLLQFCVYLVMLSGPHLRRESDLRHERRQIVRTPPVGVPQTAEDQDQVRGSVLLLDSQQKLLEMIAPTFGQEIEAEKRRMILFSTELSLLLIIPPCKSHVNTINKRRGRDLSLDLQSAVQSRLSASPRG